MSPRTRPLHLTSISDCTDWTPSFMAFGVATMMTPEMKYQKRRKLHWRVLQQGSKINKWVFIFEQDRLTLLTFESKITLMARRP